ncbi:MAG: hypothetical protein K1X74_16615 [Pirellulales bacterium]|nr:hypothetical protein [Pirellulales bacterium]
MILNKKTTFAEFCEEMQLRVVKHGPGSRPVHQALRFARGHADPRFLRVAMEKIQAQRHYRLETEGPTRWERIVSTLGLASAAEAAVALGIVILGCGAVEMARGWVPRRTEDALASKEIDRLAEKLGVQVRSEKSTQGPRSGARDLSGQARAASPTSAEVEEMLAKRLEQVAQSAAFQSAVEAAVARAIAQSGQTAAASREPAVGEQPPGAEPAPAKEAAPGEGEPAAGTPSNGAPAPVAEPPPQIAGVAGTKPEASPAPVPTQP